MFLPLLLTLSGIFLVTKFFKYLTLRSKMLSSKSLTEKISQLVPTSDSNQSIRRHMYFNDNMSFNSSDALVGKSRSLVVVFAWLYSKDRYVEKYRQIYYEKGFDVLTVRTRLFDCLVPPMGSHVVAGYVTQFLNVHTHHYEHIFVHLFSVGSYQLGEVLNELNKPDNLVISNLFHSKLRGIVFDSAVDSGNAATNLANASTNHFLLRLLIANSLRLYLRLSDNYTTKHYNSSAESVFAHRTSCPLLIFFSRSDPLIDVDSHFRFISRMTERGVDVTFRCWHNSGHVSHYVNHPEEYRECLDRFVDKCLHL